MSACGVVKAAAEAKTAAEAAARAEAEVLHFSSLHIACRSKQNRRTACLILGLLQCMCVCFWIKCSVSTLL
jgi:hypothetical protein